MDVEVGLDYLDKPPQLPHTKKTERARFFRDLLQSSHAVDVEVGLDYLGEPPQLPHTREAEGARTIFIQQKSCPCETAFLILFMT